MFVNCDTIYYELLGKKDYKKLPSYLDLFTKDDLHNVISYIEESDKNIIISYELYTKSSNEFLNKNITDKYEIYYKYNPKNDDNYVFFIKETDIKKINNLQDYKKLEKL